jgi:hypothetical protein
MRTTLNIDDDALKLLREHASRRKLSLGEAALDLIHKGIESEPKFKKKNGWVILDRPRGLPPLTTELLEQFKREEEEEELRRAFPSRR